MRGVGHLAGAVLAGLLADRADVVKDQGQPPGGESADARRAGAGISRGA